ncbi:MAG: class I SAM-dependent methyltransferase [Woeseiaceae bacterium]
MKTISVGSPEYLAKTQSPTWLDRLAHRLVIGRLSSIEKGQITLKENGRERTFGGVVDDFPVPVVVNVNSPAFYSDIAFGGSVGSGEAYIRGYWECSELEALVQILLRNRGVLDELDAGAANLKRPVQKLFHWLNRNTRRGSQKNIAAHYDLGNDFYKLWLDAQMMYSSAFFPTATASLEDAAVAKLERICQKLDLKASDTVIEIGTGWGGFAIHAASQYGCHVTTTTISEQQYQYAKAKVDALGMADKITLLKHDYRDLEGQFDKLVSIEMIEAVGHEYLDTFFAKCASLLKPEGEILIQAITIGDQRYEKAKKTVDFIKRYVFPGGFLPSLTAMTNSMTRVTQLRAIGVEDIGPHYALTLKHWRERFFDKLSDVRRQGFSDEFIRMWEFYLCYCEGAFVERAIGTIQLHAIGSDARPAVFAGG